MHQSFFKQRTTLILIVILGFVCLVIASLLLRMLMSGKTDTTSVSIILSAGPHDSELALGGLLNRGNRPTVTATFFTGSSSSQKNDETIHNFGYLSIDATTTESSQEIQSEISQDIQGLIVANADQTVYIYGPSTFATSTNNPETQIVFNAYVDVASSFPNQNVHFYFYENYPQIEQFNQTSIISLKKNIENITGLVLDTSELPLTSKVLNKKIQGLKKLKIDNLVINGDKAFTSKRCGTNKACEVIYEIHQY